MACHPSHLPLVKLWSVSIGRYRRLPLVGTGMTPDLQVQGMDQSQLSTGSYRDAGGQCWDWELCNHTTSLQGPWDRVPGLVRTQAQHEIRKLLQHLLFGSCL